MEAKDLLHWYLLPWRKYAVFAGRAPRREYWLFHLGNSLIGMFLYLAAVLASPSMLDGGEPSGGSLLFLLLMVVFSLAVIIPSLAVSTRRLHDINLSGWRFLVVLIPILGSLAFFVFTLIPGTPGENRFGPDPRKA